MPAPPESFDDAMFAFSQANYAEAVRLLEAVLNVDPEHFDARLALYANPMLLFGLPLSGRLASITTRGMPLT